MSPAPKLRLTLSARILLLAAANLLFLLGIAAMAFRLPAHLSWESVILAPSEDRILLSARLFSLDLQRTPVSQRAALMDRLSREIGAEVFLFDVRGAELAGKTVQLPPPVEGRMHPGQPEMPETAALGVPQPPAAAELSVHRSHGAPPFPPDRPDGPDMPGGRPGPGQFPGQEGQSTEWQGQAGPPGGPPDGPPDGVVGRGTGGPPQGRPGGGAPPPQRVARTASEPVRGKPVREEPAAPVPVAGVLPGNALFHVEVRESPRHWVGVHIPVGSSDSSELVPGVLLMATDSWFSGSLFFDFRPWLAAAGAALAVTLLCWIPFLRGLTRSIRRLKAATEQIAEGQFSVPTEERRADELGQLSLAIRHMADRLSQLVHGQKRFLGDVAHELCSPIARIQFALGILEQRVDEATVEDLREEVQQMSTLVQELLQFSRASLLQEKQPLQCVNLAEVTQAAADRECVTIALQMDATLCAMADPVALDRAIANLTRNAWRYAGEAGPIEVGAMRQNGHVRLWVADHGPGLPEEEMSRVVEPFYRTEAARTRETGGAGLGLAIVKSCVETCQGTMRLRNRLPHGLEVEIVLKAS